MKRLVGAVVLLVLGFLVFAVLSGVGFAVGIMFIVMHPVVIILGTLVSALAVLMLLIAKAVDERKEGVSDE